VLILSIFFLSWKFCQSCNEKVSAQKVRVQQAHLVPKLSDCVKMRSEMPLCISEAARTVIAPVYFTFSHTLSVWEPTNARNRGAEPSVSTWILPTYFERIHEKFRKLNVMGRFKTIFLWQETYLVVITSMIVF